MIASATTVGIATRIAQTKDRIPSYKMKNTRMWGAFGTWSTFERIPAFCIKKIACIDQKTRQAYQIAKFYQK
jgi:hypothetical protein